MTEKYQPIPHRLKNMAVGGHVAGAVDILDDLKDKDQQTINAEVDESIDSLNTEVADRYTKSEVNNIISRTPETDVVVLTVPEGSTAADVLDEIPIADRPNKLFRVINDDNTAYSEYGWTGSAWAVLANKDYGIDEEPTPGSDNFVKSGGVASVEGYYVDNPEYIKAELDSQNRIIWAVRKDGRIYFGGGKSPIQSEVADCFSMIENPEYVNIEIDDAGRVLGGRKANGNKVECAPIEMPSAVVESLSDAEDRIEILLDKNGRVISYRDKGGVLHEYSAVINNLDVENVNFKDGVPEQIQEYVESYIVKTEDKDIIPYNDTMRIGKVMRKVYNPYKETKTHQYKGQMHCHCWTKFGEFSDRIPYLYNHPDYDSIYEDYGVSVPISITGFHNVSGTTKAGSTIKLGDAIVAASASRFLSQHKNAGYDFMSITDYAVYGNVTQKPSVIPNDFLWLWNGYETTTKTLGVNQHMVVHNVASNESIRYNQGTFKDIMDILEDEGCIVQWPHPTDVVTPVTPDNGVVETVKSRLRFMEVYDGISMCKYSNNGTRTDRTVNALLPGVLPDDPYDQMLTQGNFMFCMAISDERPAYGRGSVDTDDGPRNTLITTENNAYNLRNGCIKVFGDNLTQKEIFDSLLAGNFYASSNADVSIQSVVISNGVYAVDTGMVGVTVEFLKENNTILRTIVTSSNSTVASYDIQGDEKFVRARVYKTRENVPPSSDYWFVDKDWCIWTQPVFISSSIL